MDLSDYHRLFIISSVESRNVKIFPTTISVLRLGLSYFDFDVLSNFMAKNLGQITSTKHKIVV